MLRLTLVCVSLILIAVCILPSQTGSTAETIQRLTTTSEETLNLNPALSSDGTVVSFESSADLAEVGAGPSFHAFRTDWRAALGFQEFARGRLPDSSLSADGQKIAFASAEDLTGENQDRNSEIYLFDGSLKQITHTAASNEALRRSDGNFAPSISNDGTLITFRSNRFSDSQRFEVILLNLSSSALTHVPSNEPIGSKLSGNGTRIFLVTGNSETSDLFAYDIATKTTRLLMEHVAGLSVTSARAVSDDGSRIVFSAQTGANQTQVFLYDIRDGAARELTQLGTRSTDVPLNATISGDGKRVMFATRRRVTSASDGSVELYLIDLPTDRTEQITNAPSSATAEVISSLNFDGSRTVFNFPRVLSGPVSHPDFSNNSEIYIGNLARRPDFGIVRIANAATRDFDDPRIAPDGIAAISGTNLSNRTEQSKLLQGDLPLSLGGTRVQVESHEARLLYVSPTEIGFVVPAGIADGPANVIVTNSEGFASKGLASVSRVAPGIFKTDNQGILLNANTFKAEPFDPTDGQLRLILFGTGIRNASQLAVTVGGEQVEVESVSRSSLPGLDEVHLRLPAELRGAGNVAIGVSANGIDANVVSTSLSGSVLREIMINEVLTDPPDGLAGDANHDGTRDSSGDEFVELVNPTSRDIDLTGYQLQSRTATASSDTVRHRFAAGTTIPAGTALVIFGGGTLETTNPLFGGAQIIRASTGGLSLSNGGGAVTLRDANGRVVTSITYGSSAGVAGDANQSITRSPDVVGVLTLHQSLSGAAGRAFSPGTMIDGSGFLPSPAAASIVISPVSAELIRGAEQQFSALALDSEGRGLDGVIFNWTSSNNSVLTIDSNGLAKAIGSGRVEVTAIGRRISSNVSIVNVATPTPTPTATPTPAPSTTPTPSPSISPTPLASPTPAPQITQVVISEFRTRGPNGASDEFVELYNNSSSSVDLSGWKLKGSSGSGTVTNRLTISNGTLITPRGHLLIANANGYSGTVTADHTFTSGFANDGGVALTLPNDNVVDQVGLSSTSAFREGMHLAPLPSDANQSYERKPGGASGSTQDTSDNFSDFQLVTPSDPQNSTSQPTPGPSSSPSPSPTINPTPTPEPSPSPNPTPTPSATPTATPTPSPGPSPSPSPSSTPIQSPSPTPTPAPSPSPTTSPSPAPSPSPTVMPTPLPSLPTLVISEFRTRGPGGASDEFIEIYNFSNNPVDAGGLKVRGSSSGGTITTKLTINTNTVIPAHGHFLATNSAGYSGIVVGDQNYTSGVANDGGVALTMSDDSIIDQVGLSPGSAFKEGMHLAPLASDANQSYERKPGGASGSTQDSQDNFSDFQLLTPSDPQNLGSGPTPGPAPSPAPSATPTASPSPSPSPSSTATPTASPSPSPSPSATATPSPTPTSNSIVVISQIFGGGGNSGAPFRNDFIELFNAGSSPVNLTGWSVQYGSATASTWSVTTLSSVTLAPGQYYLVQEGGGANGSALPTTDVTGSINLAATAGKVVLLKSTTALTGTCSSDPNIIDLVGYGSSANCFKGSAPTAAPSNTNAILRNNGGCNNANDNASDFIVAAPTPRNTTSTPHSCSSAATQPIGNELFLEYGFVENGFSEILVVESGFSGVLVLEFGFSELRSPKHRCRQNLMMAIACRGAPTIFTPEE